MEQGNEAYYNRQYGREGRRPWNERDRNRDMDDRGEDRGFFERMGDRIRDTWNDWTGNEDRDPGTMDRQRDRSRGRGGRIYNSDDYRTMGIRGGYIPEREMGNYLHNEDYDYGTGNYGAQGMGTGAYDRDFTYANRGQNAGSANIRGGYYYDENNEPVFNRERRDRYNDDRSGYDRYSNRGSEYDRTGRYGSRSDRYRGSNDHEYRRDDYTSHGERAFFGNDAYGAGVMGGYHDNFPEDFRYNEWRRGSR